MRSAGTCWHAVWFLWCLAAAAGSVAASEAGFCLLGARNLAPSDGQLSRGARSMPPAQPVLAAHDWQLSKPANEAQATTAYEPCHAAAPIFRYKVYGGAVYVDHDHQRDPRYSSYRMAFLEQLVLSMYLYKDFPAALDLVVDFTDHPQLCDQDIPFLRYSILNMSVVSSRQQLFNTTELLAPAWVTPEYAARVHGYTKGFTIPSPEAWRDLSLTPAQLADFSSCMDSTHPWSSKQLKAFWRGQATGCSRGWPLLRSPATQQGTTGAAEAAGAAGSRQRPQQQQPDPHLLRNKRVQMVLRLFPYGAAVADVGITSLPQLTPECLGAGGGGGGVAAGQQGQQQDQQQQPLQQAAPSARRRRRRQRLGGHTRPRRDLAVQPSMASAERQQHQQAQHRQLAQDADMGAPAVGSDSAGAAPAGAAGRRPGSSRERAYRGVASLLRKEGIGLEGWADAAVTLSIDGYGPPFRLPQQLLLGSAVLRMTSPYQTWLDWDLLPGPASSLQEFAYDLSDLEQQLQQLLQEGAGSNGAAAAAAAAGVGGATAEARLRAMATAARALVASRAHIVAQLDAFAWSVARYKEVCKWEVQQPQQGGGGAAAWRLLVLGPGVFQAKGVPQGLQLEVMQHLSQNFEAALQHPAVRAGVG